MKPASTLLALSLAVAPAAQGQLFGLGPEVSNAPAPAASIAPPPAAMPGLGPPLDPALLEPDSRDAGHEEWRARLESAGGPALAPLSPLDPSKPLVLLFPGNGQTFRDLHGLARLTDEYQLVAVVYDARLPIQRLGEQVADLLTPAIEAWHAQRPGEARELRMIAHSFGNPVAVRTLLAMGERGDLETLGTTRLFAMDGPFKGLDLPWIVTLPGLRTVLQPVAGFLGRVLGLDMANRGNLSVSNINGAQREIQRADLGRQVRLDFVTVVGDPTSAPLDNWYPEELSPEELGQVHRYFRKGGGDDRGLDGWSFLGLRRDRGLQGLMRSLRQDADYAAARPAFVAAARASATSEEFAPRYRELLDTVVDRFEGQHTEFMWTDSRFLPWLRGELAQPLAAPLPGPTPAGSPRVYVR